MTNQLSIVISGEAGQGLKTIETMLVQILRNGGYYFFSNGEVMSRIRGGNNTTEIRIGGENTLGYVSKIDYLFVLHADGVERLLSRIDDETMIITDEKFVTEDIKTHPKLKLISINALARESGSEIMTNIVTLGMILGVLNISDVYPLELIEKKFSSKSETAVLQNVSAFNKGYASGKTIKTKTQLPTSENNKQKAIFSGTDAVGLGAISGGCNFIGSYPMSPGTGVLTFLAKHAESFGIVVEQAEDEIAAINMCLGAWYAGARAMVTTSGGGFSLMEEGVSLSGIIEVPAVIHIAQRPGPATGLPTRTEQADLDLALYAGHGEFPRIIYAPGNNEDAFHLSYLAFQMADKYRIPVFILTDAFMLDAYALTDLPKLSQFPIHKNIAPTTSQHKTYPITKNNEVSARGIPGYGDGYVCVDSDEHDEYGRITEDAHVRVIQMNQRLGKQDSIQQEALSHEIYGEADYHTLIVGWGSTYGAIREAIETSHRKGVAFAYFKQVFPISIQSIETIRNAKKIVVVENNYSGQFANLLQRETGVVIKHRVHQYNGFPFSVEQMIELINTL